MAAQNEQINAAKANTRTAVTVSTLAHVVRPFRIYGNVNYWREYQLTADVAVTCSGPNVATADVADTCSGPNVATADVANTCSGPHVTTADVADTCMETHVTTTDAADTCSGPHVTTADVAETCSETHVTTATVTRRAAATVTALAHVARLGVFGNVGGRPMPTPPASDGSSDRVTEMAAIENECRSDARGLRKMRTVDQLQMKAAASRLRPPSATAGGYLGRFKKQVEQQAEQQREDEWNTQLAELAERRNSAIAKLGNVNAALALRAGLRSRRATPFFVPASACHFFKRLRQRVRRAHERQAFQKAQRIANASARLTREMAARDATRMQQRMLARRSAVTTESQRVFARRVTPVPLSPLLSPGRTAAHRPPYSRSTSAMQGGVAFATRARRAPSVRAQLNALEKELTNTIAL